MNYAGKDATPGFEPVHPKDIVSILPPSAYLGDVDPTTITESTDKNVQLNNENSSSQNEEKSVPVGTQPGYVR